MPPGDLVTEFYQYEYNGLVMGPNTPFHVQSVKGLLGYPALRSGSVNRFGNHGGVGGRHYLPIREFIMVFDYTPTTATEFEQRRTALMQAFAPRLSVEDELPFFFCHPGAAVAFSKKMINCRPIDNNIDVDRRFSLMFPENAIRFEAVDPLHYSALEFTASVTLAPDTTGLTFALDFPLNFGPSSSNEVSMLNGGTADASWTAEITGQIEGPRLENTNTGDVLNLPNLTVATGETLAFDEAHRTILLNGTQNKRSELTSASKWFKFPAGQTTTVRYSANGATSNSVLTFTWRYAYFGES